MWGRELRAMLVFVVISLAGGAAFREWRRAHEPRFQDLVARLSAAAAEETRASEDPAAHDPSGPGATGRPAGPARRGEAPRVGAIDVNRAGREDLMRLPGVGPVLADRIVADRSSRGPFPEAESLLRVPGIGPRTLERLTPYLAPFGADGAPPSEGAK